MSGYVRDASLRSGIFQTRRGPAASVANLILQDGELGYEVDTGKFVVGDGSTRWANLPSEGHGTASDIGVSGLSSLVGSNVRAVLGDIDVRLPAVESSCLAITAVKTANYTAAAWEFVRFDTTSGALALALPTAPADKTQNGGKIVLPTSAPNTLTVSCGGSDVLNRPGGPASTVLALVGQAVWLEYVAAAGVWVVLADDLPLSQLDARFDAAGAAASAVAAEATVRAIGDVRKIAAAVTSDVPATYAALFASMCVAGWRLNETSGTVAADTKGVVNGAYTNGPTLNQAGPPLTGDVAPLFDGSNDHVAIPHNAALQPTTALSIHCWVKPTDRAAIYQIFQKGTTGTGDYEMRIGTDGTLSFFIPGGGASSTAGAIPAGTWTHIAVTYDKVTWRVYINGLLNNTLSQGVAIGATGGTLYIGRRVDGAFHFKGSISGFGVATSILTAAQIAMLGAVQLQAGVPAASLTDGVTTVVGDVILLAGQSTQSENGPRVVATGAWTRPSDYAAGSQIFASRVYVAKGTVYGRTVWDLSAAAPVTVDAGAQTWAMSLSDDVSKGLRNRELALTLSSLDPGVVPAIDHTGATYSDAAFTALLALAASRFGAAGAIIELPPGSTIKLHSDQFIPQNIGFASYGGPGSAKINFPDEVGGGAYALTSAVSAGATSMPLLLANGTFRAATPSTPQKIVIAGVPYTYTGITGSGLTPTLTGLSPVLPAIGGQASVIQGCAMIFSGGTSSYAILNKGIEIDGPGGGSSAAWASLTTPPAGNMDGVWMGNGCVIDCPVKGFRHATVFTTDHQTWGTSFRPLNNFSGICAQSPRQSAGDQTIHALQMDGNYHSGIYITSGNFLGGANMTKCHLGSSAYGIFKEAMTGRTDDYAVVTLGCEILSLHIEAWSLAAIGNPDGLSTMQNTLFVGAAQLPSYPAVDTNYVGPFAASQAYTAGQGVSYLDQLYTAKVNFTSGASFLASDWNAAGAQPLGVICCRMTYVKFDGGAMFQDIRKSAKAVIYSDGIANCLLDGFDSGLRALTNYGIPLVQGRTPTAAPNVRARIPGGMLLTSDDTNVVSGDVLAWAYYPFVKKINQAGEAVAGVADTPTSTTNRAVAVMISGLHLVNVQPGTPGAAVPGGRVPLRWNGTNAGKAAQASSWGDAMAQAFAMANGPDNGATVMGILALPNAVFNAEQFA